MNRPEKIAVSLSALAMAGGILYTHWSGELYPGLPVGAGLAVILLATVVLSDSEVSFATFCALVLIGLVYRVYAFTFPASLIGHDPDAYAVRGLIVANTGATDGLLGGFYSIASLFSVFNAETIILAGLRADAALVAVPILASLVFPTAAAALAYRMTRSRRAAFLATAVTTLDPATVRFSLRPVPIMFAALLFTAYVVLVVGFTDRGRGARWAAISVVLFAMMLSHKIAVALALGAAVVTLIGSYWPVGGAFEQANIRTPYILVSVNSIVLSLQWLFVTDFFSSAVVLLSDIYIEATETTSLISTESGVATAAIPYEPGPIAGVIARGFVIPTLFVGALVWLYLFKSRRFQSAIARTLGVVSVVVAVSLPGLIISASGGFARVMHYTTAALGSVVAAGYRFVTHDYGRAVRAVFWIGIVAVLASQPISSAMTPDYRDGARLYLTEGEVQAKVFAEENAGLVHMDGYYKDEVVRFEAAAADGGEEFQSQVPQEWRDGFLGPELLNATLTSEEYQTVLLRTNVGVYKMSGFGGEWILTWDPVGTMAASREYHQTYSNGHSTLFVRRLEPSA